jgi:hypothetical protein
MTVDPKNENEVEIVVDAGDGIQDGVTAVSLFETQTVL